MTTTAPRVPPGFPQGSPRVPPDFARAARRLLTVTETLCGACAPHLEYWNPKAKAIGKKSRRIEELRKQLKELEHAESPEDDEMKR